MINNQQKIKLMKTNKNLIYNLKKNMMKLIAVNKIFRSIKNQKNYYKNNKQ